METIDVANLEAREEAKEEIDPVYIQEAKEELAYFRSEEQVSPLSAAAAGIQERVSNATPRSMARSQAERTKYKDLFAAHSRSNPAVEQAEDQVGGTDNNVILNVVHQNDRYGEPENEAINLLDQQFNRLSDQI